MVLPRFFLVVGILALIGWSLGLGPASGVVGILLLIARLASLDEEEAALAAKVASFALIVIAVWSLIVRGAPVLPAAISAIAAALLGVALVEIDRRELSRDLVMRRE